MIIALCLNEESAATSLRHLLKVILRVPQLLLQIDVLRSAGEARIRLY